MVQKIERKGRKPLLKSTWLPWLCAPLMTLIAAEKAVAAGQPVVNLFNNNTPVLLAQVTTPGVLPTDATKGNLLQDRANAYPGFKLRLFQKLPANLWIQGSTEVNQRLDTNVFLQYKEPQPDYVFRAAPSLTVGYNVLDTTSVYAQYFVIKDVYTVHHRQLTPPTTQSIAMGLRHTFPPMFKNKVSIYLDGQARELFQSRGLRQADLTPSINATIFATQKLTLFSSATMQMRSGQLFLGPQREIDCFYTMGGYYRSPSGKWVFSVTDTFVTNFRHPHFKFSIPRQGNVNMIADFEVDRQIGNIPGLQAILRAEPVWNWRSRNVPGLSGFDFRLYSGLRLSFYKPSYGGTMNAIKKQLQQQDDPNAKKAPPKKIPKIQNKGKVKGVSPTNPATDEEQKDGDTKPGEIKPGDAESTKTDTSMAPSADPNILFPTQAQSVAPVAKAAVDSTPVQEAQSKPLLQSNASTSVAPSVIPCAATKDTEGQKTALETQAQSL